MYGLRIECKQRQRLVPGDVTQLRLSVWNCRHRFPGYLCGLEIRVGI